MRERRRAARAGAAPLKALLLAFPMALFSAALATDIAYLRTAEIQWSNFSAWLNAGALLFGAIVLAWILLQLLLDRRSPGRGRRGLVAALLALTCGFGLINAFQHSRDGWSSVGALGLGLSAFAAAFALAAGWLFHSSKGTGR